MISKNYDFNVWFNEDENRFTVYAFKLVIDHNGLLDTASSDIIDRIDIYVDDKITVQEAEVITYVLKSGDWTGTNGLDYLYGVEDWISWGELFDSSDPVPQLLQDLVDRLPSNKLDYQEV